MIWAKEETMSRDEIEALQLERLKETVTRVYEKVVPYRRKMEKACVKPEDIQTLKDLSRLPFVTKQDMRDNCLQCLRMTWCAFMHPLERQESRL